MAHQGPQCPEPVQFPREGIDHAQQRSNAARQHLASGMCCAAGKKRHALENSRSSALSYMNQIARYFTSGFVGLNTSVGLSFQVHACTIQLVSAVNRPPRSMHCHSVSRMKVAALCGVKTPD
jgi:hypothetical protein